MIAGEIRRYLRDNSAIRVSRSVRDTAYRVLQCKEQMQLELGRDPSLEEVAQRLGLQRGDVVSAMDAITAPVSLFEPVYADGGDPLMVMDQVRDTRNTDEHWLERIALRDAMGQLESGKRRFSPCAFGKGRPRWRWRGRLESPRRRSPAWRKTPWAPFARPSVLKLPPGA